VKKNNLTLGVCAALLLSSTLAVAESDYPAADFQPKVLFQDSDYKSTQSDTVKSSSASESADPNYPAANFQPKVVYQDETASTSSTSKHVAHEAEASVTPDSVYPASNFQPQVLYNDPNYKPDTASSAARENSVRSVVEGTKLEKVVKQVKVVADTLGVVDTTSKNEDSLDLSLIGLLLAALIGGFVVFKKTAKPTIAESAKGDRISTGVARYLQARDKNSVSGVAKYLAKQAESAKAAETKTTKVETYLRNRS
jgi:hypothetical protein